MRSRSPVRNSKPVRIHREDIFVIPKSLAPHAKALYDLTLFAANCTKIPTYGTKRISHDFSLRRQFTWSFVIADVRQPIIGVNFLKHFNLLVDAKHHRVSDSKTKLSSNGQLPKIKRLLPHAAETQAPLNKLLTNCKKNNKRSVLWNEEAEIAFLQCKSSSANVATLAYPSPDLQFYLLVDVSKTAVAAALNCSTTNGPKPIAIFSRKLSATETKYSIYDRELLTIYLAINTFRTSWKNIILIIFTDHHLLIFEVTKISDSCSLRQFKHLDFISQFSTNIRHVSGSDSSVAYSLSRINAFNLSTTDLQHLANSQTNDEELKTFNIFQ
ncbi:retrovirus-related Pol polyprotein from transposon opus [Nephila pilipes]|uniref:Retrovirus-related Pol polyprotein from transposon opus n=1 Tax=Nephila pilipes TaxID=299642 RepID=A0A8X6NU81_NEPPI|nr:retrovirus-related Pol polyprotein from transposon opus [Nephila pilipes]